MRAGCHFAGHARMAGSTHSHQEKLLASKAFALCGLASKVSKVTLNGVGTFPALLPPSALPRGLALARVLHRPHLRQWHRLSLGARDSALLQRARVHTPNITPHHRHWQLPSRSLHTHQAATGSRSECFSRAFVLGSRPRKALNTCGR